MHPTTWTLDDALALRCPVEAVGRLRPASEVVGPSLEPTTPTRQRMEAFALAHLCRIAQGDDRAAVEACRELLTRCAPPPGAATPGNDPASWPEWLTSRRLAYQEGGEREAAPDQPALRDETLSRQH